MNTTSVTIALVFGVAVLFSWPLGWVFKIQPKPGRFTHIDGMRAIAALMVVCSHYLAHSGLVMGDQTSAALRDSLGAVGVQIFFCITGFLFTRKAMAGPVDISSLIASRVRRIVPLYLLVMTIAIALATYIATAAHTGAGATYQEILRAYTYGFFGVNIPSVAGMSMGGQVGQMWTLSWEWQFYLLVPFIGVLLMRSAWAVSALAFAVICMASPLGAASPWTFFLPGVLCALVSDKFKPSTTEQAVLAVIGLAAFAFSLSLNEPAYGISQMALCMIGFPALLFGHRALLSIKPLRLLGEVSYSIYMIHLVFASAFWIYIQGGDNWKIYKTPEDKLPIALLFLVGMIVLSFVTYALIERPFLTSRRESEPAKLTPAVSS